MPTKIKRFKRSYRVTRYVIYKETFVNATEHFWSFVGALVGIALIGYTQENVVGETLNLQLIGSFGASSVLVYGAIQSPLAQPRNLIGGHFISALIGVTAHLFVPGPIWLAAAVAVALSIVAMQITKTLHPPGGATALIAVTGGDKITELGYGYALSPVLSGACILLIVALLFNNCTPYRHYPVKPLLGRVKRFTRQ